jgi:hypothetical protein
MGESAPEDETSDAENAFLPTVRAETPPGPEAYKRKILTRADRETNAAAYEWTAWASTCGIMSIAITATYLRLLREVGSNARTICS